MTSQESDFSSFFEDLNLKIHEGSSHVGIRAAITPFLLLEYLGAQVKNIEISKSAIPDPLKIGLEASNQLLDIAIAAFSKEIGLSKIRLLENYNLSKSRVKPHAVAIFDVFVSKFVRQPNFSSDIHTLMGLDFIYRYKFAGLHKKSSIEIQLLQRPILDLIRMHCDRRNFTQTRAVFALATDFQKRIKRSKRKFSKEEDALLQFAKKVKSFRDLADLDLIQLAIFGAFSGDCKYPALVVTSDPKSVVIGRLQLFHTIFSLFSSNIPRAILLKKYPTGFPPFLPGKIVFVNSDKLRIEEVISVGQELKLY